MVIREHVDAHYALSIMLLQELGVHVSTDRPTWPVCFGIHLHGTTISLLKSGLSTVSMCRNPILTDMNFI